MNHRYVTWPETKAKHNWDGPRWYLFVNQYESTFVKCRFYRSKMYLVTFTCSFILILWKYAKSCVKSQFSNRSITFFHRFSIIFHHRSWLNDLFPAFFHHFPFVKSPCFPYVLPMPPTFHPRPFPPSRGRSACPLPLWPGPSCPRQAFRLSVPEELIDHMILDSFIFSIILEGPPCLVNG